MKSTQLGIAFATCLLSTSASHGQGLLSIGADDDFYSALPFTTSIGIDTGWDSNPSSSSGEEKDSAFVRGGIDVAYGSGSRVTPVKMGAGFSTLYYFDDIGVDEDVFYNAKIMLNVRHMVNRRLTIGNNFYLSYESEPDLSIGASNQQGIDQYLYGYNSLWASYAWSRRFSSITRYTVSGIRYDDNRVGERDDRFTQTIAQELRYRVTRRSVAVGEYRFAYTNYDTAPRDYTSNYILAGFDHDFSRTLTAQLRAGVELRDDDFYGNETRPYGELSFRHRVAERTSIHWTNRVGLEDSELGSFATRYTWRSTLSANHDFSKRLAGRAGVSYLHNDFEDSVIYPDRKEDLVSVDIGLRYRVLSNVDLNTNYTFMTVASDEEFREYDRHRVSVGLSTTF